MADPRTTRVMGLALALTLMTGACSGDADRVDRRQATPASRTAPPATANPTGRAPAAREPSPAAEDEIPVHPFHDAHVHLNDIEMQLALMDEWKIERAVVMRGRAAGHEDLLEAARRHPGRLLPFLSVSPEFREYRSAWEADDSAGLVGEARRLLESGGFHGIGEISVTHFPGTGFPEADFDPDGAIMRGLLALADEHDIPVTVHAEITRLRELEAVLERFPDVTVIWAHGGYAPYFLTRRLLDAHPNLYVDLSARTWRSHPRSPDYTIFRNEREVWPEWLDLIEAMPDRFLVGTDASLRSHAAEVERIRRVQLLLDQLSDSTREQVSRRNLERLVDRRASPVGRGGS